MRHLPLVVLLLAEALTGQVAKFRVRETAGLRRFSYPVRATLPVGTTDLRLLENGKPIPAQFTALASGEVEVDFNVGHGPFELKEYQVEPGTGPAAGGQGLRVEETDRDFLVKHPASLEFAVPKNLLGLLDTVGTNQLSYLRPGSAGLVLNSKDDIEYRAGGVGHWGERTKARVLKRGPMACALRFESTEGLRGNRSVKSVVEMQFPRSKSWAEVLWTVEDPDRLVTGMIVDLNLLLEGPPTLVDFGAGSMVYDALRQGQHAALQGGPPQMGSPLWTIDVDGQPFAAGSRAPVEGWAHVMDKQRATAVAVPEFARGHPDRIEVSSEGRLRIRRDFPGGGERSLRFWLHFVTMPVQVGAATSPQSMQTPMQIEWE